MSIETERRTFIKNTAITNAGLALAPEFSLANDKARIALIGVGSRGRNHLHNILNRDDVLVPVKCDIDPEAVDRALSMIDKA